MAHRKGDEYLIRNELVGQRKAGMWQLDADDKEPEGINEQVQQVLARLTQVKAIWAGFAARFEMDFFCGFFMGRTNEILKWPIETMRMLSDRGIALCLDV